MKKLALIGSSSAHIENGYGLLLKKYLGDECDIYTMGGSTIVWPMFAILSANIVNEYEYVVICYGTNDTNEIKHLESNYSIHICYLAFIAKMFKHSRSIPIVLFSAFLNYPIQDKYNSYIRGVCNLFNIPFIDLHKYFEYIDPSTCVIDGAHYRKDLMEYIADKILEVITMHHVELNDIPIEINFDLLYPKELPNITIPYELRGVAIDPTFYIMTSKNTFKIPEDKFLSGIFYRIGSGTPYLFYKNTCITMSKNLDFMGLKDVDYCYSIGASIFNGLKGGYLGVSLNQDYTIVDPSLYAFKRAVDNPSPLYIHSFLISDLPPAKYGYQIYDYYRQVFLEAEYDLYKILLRKEQYNVQPFWKKLEEFIPNSKEIFTNVLNFRPDLIRIFNDDDEFRAEKIILWSWKFGIYENPILKEHIFEIATAIKKMLNYKYYGKYENYPLLLHIIWLTRHDLSHFNPETKEGLQNIKNWFINHGKDEYLIQNLDDYI